MTLQEARNKLDECLEQLKVMPKKEDYTITLLSKMKEFIDDNEFCIICNNHVYDTKNDMSNHSEDCSYRVIMNTKSIND